MPIPKAHQLPPSFFSLPSVPKGNLMGIIGTGFSQAECSSSHPTNSIRTLKGTKAKKLRIITH